MTEIHTIQNTNRYHPNTKKLTDAVKAISGKWTPDLPLIAAIKVLEGRPATKRRITAGQISDGLLVDEDYIEVLRDGSFRASDLQEARISSSEVAKQEHIGSNLMTGPTPDFASILWRHQHREASRALDRRNVRQKIVTHSGREK